MQLARIKLILEDQQNHYTTNHPECPQYDEFTSFIKCEHRTSILKYIKQLALTMNLHQLSHPRFKDITKLVYKYKTAFHEQHIRMENDSLDCPTCGGKYYIKGWLTQRRKNSARRVAEYYMELGQLKICTSPGCGLIFASHLDRGERENTNFGTK